MTRHVVVAAGLAGSMTLSLSAQGENLVEKGKAVYDARECDRCHMVAGRGYKDGKLDGVASKMGVEEMRRWLTAPAEMEATLEKSPKVKMSSRKRMTLTDAEVTALVAYLRTLR